MAEAETSIGKTAFILGVAFWAGIGALATARFG